MSCLPVWTNKAKELALGNRKGNILQSLHLAVALANMANLNGRHSWSLFSLYFLSLIFHLKATSPYIPIFT